MVISKLKGPTKYGGRSLPFRTMRYPSSQIKTVHVILLTFTLNTLNYLDMNNVIEISDDESEEDEDDDDPESQKLFKDVDNFVNLFNLEEEFEGTCGSGIVADAFTSTKDTLSQNLNCSPRPTCYNVNGLEGNEIQGNCMATVPEQSCDYPKAPEKGEDTFLTSTQDLFVTQKNYTSDLLVDEHDVIIISSDDDSVDEGDNVGGGDKRDADDSGAYDGDDGLEIRQCTPSDNSQSSMASLSPWLNKASLSQTFLFKDEEHDEDSASSQKITDKNCNSSGTVPTCQVLALATQTKPNTISRTNSFDKVPRQASQEFAHSQPTRKKDERQKLDGYTCSLCYPYYKSLSQSPEEMKENVNRSSRHRERFRAPPSPEGFWDLGFPKSDEEKQDEEENDTLLSSSPTQHRRRIRLEKKFKSKSEEEAAVMQSQEEPQRRESKD